MEKSVRLISYSQGEDGKNLLEQIAYVARVSNPSNQNNDATAEKLVRYLIKHQHWSPLEMVSVCLEISTTRDIARQILRHRSFSFQEFSQRYAVADSDYKLKEARKQDEKNRQNSVELDMTIDSERQLAYQWEMMQNRVIVEAKNAYEWALTKGIAKEQARAVLPEGMTASKLYMSGTMRSWVHYIQLRSANGTQKEHRQIAIECANTIEPIFPMIKEYVSV
jgi:thymidylate synthase (FAD)